MEQMEKNQEERSLLAEQREQEKEQMLEYMEKLQEEDLRVTGLHRSRQVLPATSPPHCGAGACALTFRQTHVRFTSSPPTFYCRMKHLFGRGLMGMSSDLDTVPAFLGLGVQD